MAYSTQHPSMPSPTSPLYSTAHSSHLQELQHQVSVKTLALQTIQREYDSLLQRLQRQQSKCATLERKFEVTDVEINSLTDERERLMGQVAQLEGQVEELIRARDESRNQLVASGAQYMKIMDMASRLQAQGAEEKRKWSAEQEELERRLAGFEALERRDSSMPVNAAPSHDIERGGAASPMTAIPDPLTKGLKEPAQLVPETASSQLLETDSVDALQQENSRLRGRLKTLEEALQELRREGHAVQAASEVIAGSGGRIQAAVDRVLPP